jgi:hypothetical protein
VSNGAPSTGKIFFNGEELSDSDTMQDVKAFPGACFYYQLPVEEQNNGYYNEETQ